MIEHFYSCPHCFCEVSILIDISKTEQEFIEDCERCCNPLEFNFSVQNGADIEQFLVRPIGQ